MTSHDDVDAFFGASSIGSPLKQSVWSQDDFPMGRAIVHHYQCQTIQKLNETPDERHIPQIIHFIWLGNELLPLASATDGLEENDCIASWRRVHPKGTIRVWGDQDVDATASWYNQEALQYAVRNGNYGMASDILRLELLWEYGGTYVDVDYLCIGNINNLMRRFDFFCGASNTGAVELNNGLMGCHPRNALIRAMMEAIHEWFESFTKNSQPYYLMATYLDPNSQNALNQVIALTPDDIIRNTGPGLLTRTIAKTLTEESSDITSSMAILPFFVFHPLPNTFRRQQISEDVIQSRVVEGETKAMHLWQCSWM